MLNLRASLGFPLRTDRSAGAHAGDPDAARSAKPFKPTGLTPDRVALRPVSATLTRFFERCG